MWERLGLTLILTASAFLFVCVVSVPIGIYSAVRQYSLGDYIATSIGFLGLAVPSFLLALILMYLGFRYFGHSIGGFFSPDFTRAEWSWARVVDLLSHLWMPMLAVGLAGTASLIRIVRANLLDELLKPYVAAARAKGALRARPVAQVSGAAGPDSVRGDGRLDAAAARVGSHHRIGGDEPAGPPGRCCCVRCSGRTCTWRPASS